jgi:mRNA interferase RelE/StbE
MYRYELTPEAKRQIKKLTPEIARTILRKLEFFLSTDSPISFAERLTNFQLGQYRFRIGDYRVIFDVHSDTMVILAVGNRRDIYK